jgi:hypothetical protein
VSRPAVLGIDLATRPAKAVVPDPADWSPAASLVATPSTARDGLHSDRYDSLRVLGGSADD